LHFCGGIASPNCSRERVVWARTKREEIVIFPFFLFLKLKAVALPDHIRYKKEQNAGEYKVFDYI
jgi:hypothetical protein